MSAFLVLLNKQIEDGEAKNKLKLVRGIRERGERIGVRELGRVKLFAIMGSLGGELDLPEPQYYHGNNTCEVHDT